MFRVEDKVVLVTGGTRGIGLGIAKAFSEAGAKVFTCGRTTPADDFPFEFFEGDVRDADSAAVIIRQVLHTAGRLDVLINNAGLFTNETINSMDFDAIQRQFDINAMVPLKLTMMLLPYMAEGSKIANITSRMGSIADNTSGSYYGYRASKAALNAFGKSLAMDLKPQGIAVAQLHPGFVKTRMVGFNGDITPEEAAQGLAARIDELTLENSGGFWHSNGQELPW